MYLSLIMGFISGIGFCVAIETIKKTNKINGILQLLLTILLPIISVLWCSQKNKFVFGGSNLDFFIRTLIIDKHIISWTIAITYIAFIGLMLYNIFKIQENKKQIRNN